VRIGWISYGVYLWHVPVFLQLGVLRQPGDSAAPLGRSALACSLTFAAALTSYVLIERPFLGYNARLGAKPEIAAGGTRGVSGGSKNGGHALPASL
jgi:peptidoglycan/LPS O-acetylase OafA/YrhL